MISIGKNGLRAEFAHLIKSKGFDGGASGGANKGWCFDVAVRSMDDAGAHEVGLFFDVKF